MARFMAAYHWNQATPQLGFNPLLLPPLQKPVQPIPAPVLPSTQLGSATESLKLSNQKMNQLLQYQQQMPPDFMMPSSNAVKHREKSSDLSILSSESEAEPTALDLTLSNNNLAEDSPLDLTSAKNMTVSKDFTTSQLNPQRPSIESSAAAGHLRTTFS